MQKFIATVATALALVSSSAAAAGAQCPEDQRGLDVRAPGPKETHGESETLLGYVVLGQGIQDRVLRLRRMSVAPGGQTRWHEHGDRSLLFFVESGVFTEYRSDCRVPIEHRAGDAVEETIGTKHWWRNEGSVPVLLLLSDIAKADAPAALNLPPTPSEKATPPSPTEPR